MADSTSLRNILIEHLKTVLIQKMMTDVDEEPTELGLVKIGKLQDDPTVYVKNLMVRESEDKDPDEIYTDSKFGFEGVSNLIGGGYHAYWWRKFRLRFDLYFPPEDDRDTARSKANIIQARAETTIQRMNLPDVTDSFGESPSMVFVATSHFREAGGPGSFIWKGEITVYFLTEKDTTLIVS